MNYYNENDPKAAQWLRNLIAGGMIPAGYVDQRSIEDVRPDDLRGYTQHHFFTGIGGWSEALRLANWDANRLVWTGSCPCQSFSSAGKQKGFDDPRHLWPVWFELIKVCKPPVIFGEQVEAAIKYGWLDLVFNDLEAEGYTCAAVVLPACGLGAPHIRKRLWFMAYRDSDASGGNTGSISGEKITSERGQMQDCDRFGNGSTIGKLANPIMSSSKGQRVDCRQVLPITESKRCNLPSTSCSVVHTPCGECARRECGRPLQETQPHNTIATKLSSPDSQTHAGIGLLHDHWATAGFWRGSDWICCTDGKSRPIEPGTLPLADGVQGRLVKIRGYGNAIVPQVAAEVIKVGMEYLEGVQ